MADPASRDRIRLTAGSIRHKWNDASMNVSPYRLLHIARWTVIGLTGLAALTLGYSYWHLPSTEPAGDDPVAAAPVYAWPSPVTIEPDDWGVVERRGDGDHAHMGPLGQRFRLAGTFFAYPGEGAPTHDGTRHAILDDLRGRKQHLVQENDEVDTIRVVSIFRDRIILRGAAGEEELWLSFTGRTAEPAVPDPEERAELPLRFEDLPALETSRFGKRIGENRWVFQRDELVRYFDELQEDPERMTAIFMAMQPDYDEEEGHVAGFQLEMLGEDVLYMAAGFQNGDIVRMVNSMPMTSPARAEYFIREFLNERISALVFDIERDGREEKLIHLIR
jgi:type II secretory pathway component PulC